MSKTITLVLPFVSSPLAFSNTSIKSRMTVVTASPVSSASLHYAMPLLTIALYAYLTVEISSAKVGTASMKRAIYPALQAPQVHSLMTTAFVQAILTAYLDYVLTTHASLLAY